MAISVIQVWGKLSKEGKHEVQNGWHLACHQGSHPKMDDA